VVAARRSWPIGQCRVCLGWGELPQYADCRSCATWRRLHPDLGSCRRCRHEGHLNTDGLCRRCLIVIRLDDPEWILDQPAAGRPSQLMLTWVGMPGVPHAQPLDKLAGRPHASVRPASWLEKLRTEAKPVVDDPLIFPPAPAGQMLLFRTRRHLALDQSRRIRGRDLRDFGRVRAEAIAYATELGYSTAWWRAVCWRIRLALAVREADGDALVRTTVVRDLPDFQDAVTTILSRAGLLDRNADHRTASDDPRLRGCKDCGAWGIHEKTRCTACQQWKYLLPHPAGRCERCRRCGLPVRDGLCRACLVHLDLHGPAVRAETWTQLWLGGPLAPRLRTLAGSLGYVVPHQRERERRRARRPPAQPVSAHLLIPGQGVLFPARRDWSCIEVGALDQLPSLTPRARELVDEFQRQAQARAWQPAVRRLAARSLRILLARLGADTPISEADVRALPSDRPGTSARRVLQFLDAHGLLEPDPERYVTAHERAVERSIQKMPDLIGEELRSWVAVMRGEGRRRHPTMSYESIRKYVSYVEPVILSWAGRVQSLREITGDDVRDVLKGRTGNHARSVHGGLCSMFRALKQERLVFRDPTRGISLAAATLLPVPLPADRLAGAIDRATGPMAKLTVALVAIHALGKYELIRLHLGDLDLSRGRLTVHRDTLRHTVYLDELSLALAAAWLRERHRRWPVTANPYLLVSQQTAADDRNPPVSKLVIEEIFRPLGFTASKLRQDRFLDEARQTEDPVGMMHVFGISATTAMKYIATAHPERRSTLPR
jgi:hypothetical protein